MLTPNTLLRMIDDARSALGIDHQAFAEKAGISASHWRSIRSGRRALSLDMVPHLAKAAQLSFQVIAPHHEIFMRLTPDEVRALLSLAEHYKKNAPKQANPLRSAVEKLTGE